MRRIVIFALLLFSVFECIMASEANEPELEKKISTEKFSLADIKIDSKEKLNIFLNNLKLLFVYGRIAIKKVYQRIQMKKPDDLEDFFLNLKIGLEKLGISCQEITKFFEQAESYYVQRIEIARKLGEEFSKKYRGKSEFEYGEEMSQELTKRLIALKKESWPLAQYLWELYAKVYQLGKSKFGGFLYFTTSPSDLENLVGY